MMSTSHSFTHLKTYACPPTLLGDGGVDELLKCCHVTGHYRQEGGRTRGAFIACNTKIWGSENNFSGRLSDKEWEHLPAFSAPKQRCCGG